jgi:hypothetical protein
MRKPVFFTVLFLLLYSSITAQTEKQNGGWAVTLAPALIPISQPGFGIQPGVEYRFNDRYSLLAEITIPANKKNSRDSSELNKKYFRFKSEIRYSLLGKNKKSHMYTGLQVSGSNRKFINQNSFYFDNRKTDSGYYYSKASINSPVTTVSVQLGSIFSKGRFAVDVFTGIGARFIKTTITGIENPTRSAIRKPDSGPSFTASYSYLGNIIMLQLNAGIRFMWNFYQVQHPQKK